mmetsp:Transcript_27019/g.64169  ORF Transcript_27019/g.64169 Transcript_27019/m.64169 type:complete len:114 (-) Transcript_27019:99-440(-)
MDRAEPQRMQGYVASAPWAAATGAWAWQPVTGHTELPVVAHEGHSPCPQDSRNKVSPRDEPIPHPSHANWPEPIRGAAAAATGSTEARATSAEDNSRPQLEEGQHGRVKRTAY